MRNEEEKLRFNTFIYATLAIHWTLCHRYLVFRGWFNSRILSIVHRLHVDSVFFLSLDLSRLIKMSVLENQTAAQQPNCMVRGKWNEHDVRDRERDEKRKRKE